MVGAASESETMPEERQTIIDAWEETQDYRALIGHELDISWDEGEDDPDCVSLSERMFMDKREAFWVALALGETAGAEGRARPAGERGASRERLYEKRSVKNRRVTFLELVAWAIGVIEDLPDEAAFRRFEESLQRARREGGWGTTPWPKATQPDRFHEHVARMAEGFTVRRGDYAARTLD